MKIALVSDAADYEEFRAAIPDVVEVTSLSERDMTDDLQADAIFILKENIDRTFIKSNLTISVFLNAVIGTRTALNLAANVSRLNAWPGFLSRPGWELVSVEQTKARSVIESFGKKAHFISDVNGMVTPRIIAMVINEAYFALGEAVSSKAEIDIAMKLGTNYPYGPFEWAKKIGLNRIAQLLLELSETYPRCKPAASLLAELDQEKMNSFSKTNNSF